MLNIIVIILHAKWLTMLTQHNLRRYCNFDTLTVPMKTLEEIIEMAGHNYICEVDIKDNG